MKNQMLSDHVQLDIRVESRPTKNELRYMQKDDWLQWSFANWTDLCV